MPAPVLLFLERFGNVVGRLLLTLVYIVAVAPVAIFYKLFGDALMLKPPAASSYQIWVANEDTVEDSRRQD